MKTKRRVRKGWLIVLGLLALFTAILVPVIDWYAVTFDIGIETLLYTLTLSTKGTGKSVIGAIVSACLPSVAVCVLLFALFVDLSLHPDFPVRMEILLPRRRKRFTLDLRRILRAAVSLGICAAFLGSILYAYRTVDIQSFLEAKSQPTTIYEDYYAAPDSVALTAPEGGAKNLIWIYLESMETSYASREDGGAQPVNYIPHLTELARENLSFSNTQALGGFYSGTGTGWTMAALFASSCGLPFAFPIGHNSVSGNFASGTVTLGELLQARGYINEFLCGSDVSFAGRGDFFRQHGDYTIFDYFTALEQGYAPADHYVWWGIEDYILYEIARDEVTRLAAAGEPFNLTMLTVDTHHTGGYVCELCGDEYEDPTANVVACADRQVYEFVRWCQEQDFYENTVIVITGDHPRMDICLMENVTGERPVYNCILNAAPSSEVRRYDRQFTALDLFPTVLSAMGFQIEGGRLGLGVDLFSGQTTLAEQLGVSAMYQEFTKYSAYYINTFS